MERHDESKGNGMLNAGLSRRRAMKLALMAIPVVSASGYMLSTSGAAYAETASELARRGAAPLSQQGSRPARATLAGLRTAWGPYGDLGAYKPDSSRSGVPRGTALTPLYGNQVITTPGTVIENKEIFGKVTIRAANVTIRRSRIWGTSTAPTTSTGIIDCGSSACVNALIEDCTLRPQLVNYLADGVQGHDYTVRRCDISGAVDGFGVMNVSSRTAPANVRIEGNYVHGLAYRATPSTIHSDLHTHNDGIQIHGNGSVWIQGNNIAAFTDPAVSDLVNPYASTGNQVTGQAIALTPILGSITNVHILSNWIDGGAEGGVHAVVGSQPASNIGEIKRNRFGRNQRPIKGIKYTVRVKAALTVDLPLSGADANVFADTGLPVSVVRY